MQSKIGTIAADAQSHLGIPLRMGRIGYTLLRLVDRLNEFALHTGQGRLVDGPRYT